jgi:predicted metal-dependent phosphoesterase TrpH
MIDLHIHSRFSDGTDSIDDIIKIAKEKNIPALALTDHDTTYGIIEMLEKAKKENIKVVPGVEISSVSNGHIIHILGYNIDIENNQLQELLTKIGNYFTETFLEHYNWLYKNNILDFDVNKIIKYADYKQTIALSDILKAMIADGAPYTLKDWPEFLSTKVMHFQGHFKEKFPIHPSEAIEVINQAGGTAVFAHPARIGDADIKEMEQLLSHKLGGVEVYYPFHDTELVNRYETFANKHNLFKTGGTDWHGKELTTWNVEIGDYGINETNFNLLLKN